MSNNNPQINQNNQNIQNIDNDNFKENIFEEIDNNIIYENISHQLIKEEQSKHYLYSNIIRYLKGYINQNKLKQEIGVVNNINKYNLKNDLLL